MTVQTDSHISLSAAKRLRYGLLSLRDILRTGHCAPAVMRTLLTIRGAKDQQMLFPVAGMAGGVGLSEKECGAATSPIATLGLMYGSETNGSALPKTIELGQRFLDRFASTNGSVICARITPDKSTFRPCLKAMCTAPTLLMELLEQPPEADLDPPDSERPAANKALLDHFSGCGFHCARAVLEELGDEFNVDDQLLRASYGFIGGTVLTGMSCSALVAGVLAISLKRGGIESSYLKVLRMMALFSFSPDNAMNNDVNNANQAINTSYGLSLRFHEKFGSTLCHDIVQADFSTQAGVESYISENKIETCTQIATFVAKSVRDILNEGDTNIAPAKHWARTKA